MDNQQLSTSSSSSLKQEEMTEIGDKQVEKKLMKSNSGPEIKVEVEDSSSIDQLEMNNQGPSKWDEIEDGPEEKRLMMNSQSESENQDDVEMKCFIDELPPEMLLKILEYLNVKSLAASRLVSRRWNPLAREIIQSSEDVVTVFTCWKIRSRNGKIGGRASLENFMECFKGSKESPLYTRFRFTDIEPFGFECEDWLKFISDFGPSVKSLKVEIKCDFIRIVEKLANLLLNQLPNLQEFGFYDDYYYCPPGLQLFPASTSTIQLPNIKVLYLNERFLKHTGIVTELLHAAVNLQRIEPFEKYQSFSRIETFQLLQSLGKLNCLEIARILLDDAFLSKIQGQSSMPFKLKQLHLIVSLIYKHPTFWSDAAGFISHLFESSKDTLTKLTMDSFGFLSDLQLPKFSKLTNLTFFHVKSINSKVLPPGVKLNQGFPLLQHLELGAPWNEFFPSDVNQDQNGSCLPNLRRLKITGSEMRKEDISQISQVFPNLKELDLCNDSYSRPIENFPEVGNAIWTHLTKLEFLNLDIYLDSPANAFPALDSCFTGFSGEDVIRLYDLIENEKAAKKQGSKSESMNRLEAERKNPSILDLKDLRDLTVNFHLYERTPKEMLIVSEKYAFQLMENLKYKIN